MKRFFLILELLAFSLSACMNNDWVTAAPNPFLVTPSRPPKILSPTPLLIYPTTSATLPPPPSPTPSQSPTAGPSPTITLPPTKTETATPPPTFTITPEPFTVQLLGCDTGFDLTHGMGEVTNAYVILANTSGLELTTVCATLSSDDEGRLHPDKLVCIPSLPTGYQVALKLTIDTTFRMDTIVNVEVKSNEGIYASAGGRACRDIGAFKPKSIGELQPIP